MEEDSKVKKYMDHIRKHPKFQPNGILDESGFYNQQDGSFFDPEGYYFNSDGYDELGGYYDENGDYIEEGMEGYGYNEREDDNIEAIGEMVAMKSLEHAGPKTVFSATLTNLPFKATKEQIEGELKKYGIGILSMDIQIDDYQNLSQVDLEIEGKSSAEALLELKGKKFLGRPLRLALTLQEDYQHEVKLNIYLRLFLQKKKLQVLVLRCKR